MKIFKKIYNIDELNSIKTQYEEPLRKKEVLVYGLIPAVYLFVFLFFLFYNISIAVIGAVVGGVYGVATILPKMIYRNHYVRSQRERNRFLNSLTQNLVNDNVTTPNGLETVSHRLNGELSKDVEALVTELKYGDDSQKQEAYEVIIDKYASDRIFVQYIDQLQTATQEGRNNIDELDSLAAYHDEILDKQNVFFDKKQERLLYYVLATVLSGAILFILGQSTWNYGYHEQFANGVVGWFIGSIYLGINIFYSHKFIVDYFDDEIMEVKK